MRSGFKMKQSPAKRGDIQGTSGHASALKASPARIGGLLQLGKLAGKVRTYFKGGDKVKDVVKTTTTTTKNKHKLTKSGPISKSTKAYKDMIAEQNTAIREAVDAKKDGFVKKAMTRTGVATTGYGAYKLGNWLFGSGSTDATAEEVKVPYAPPVLNNKGFEQYKRK